GKIGNISGVVVRRPLNHDGVTHDMSSLSQTGLLENAILSSNRQLVAHLTRNSDTPAFDLMFELAMAALGRDLVPAVFLQQPENLADLHAARISDLKPVRKRFFRHSCLGSSNYRS